MKNAINYYYNLISNDIHQQGKKYYFSVNDKNYLLMNFYGDINQLKYIYDYLITNHIYCHEIILNKSMQMITIINNEPYILLSIHCQNRKINLQDIINYAIPIDTKIKLNWYNLWCEKLDYYEYQMEQYEKKYQKLSESFTYFDGMTETAISLLNTVDLNKVKLYISHSRINSETTTIDFYNPLNFLIDTRVRNICEYIKSEFFDKKVNLFQISNYINNYNLSKEESILFLARMIYPSYYFDIYDEIVKGDIEKQSLDNVIDNINDYERFLFDICKIMNTKYQIPEIEWLIKM